mmetsp:Transcript_48712/g.127297  ORF Transcript_48712/g.127297 Transcript_48712/m.127297 type:complete len:282 (-) Transcript_48712:2-847(-)
MATSSIDDSCEQCPHRISRPGAAGSVIRRPSVLTSGCGGTGLRFEHAVHFHVVAPSSPLMYSARLVGGKDGSTKVTFCSRNSSLIASTRACATFSTSSQRSNVCGSSSSLICVPSAGGASASGAAAVSAERSRSRCGDEVLLVPNVRSRRACAAAASCSCWAWANEAAAAALASLPAAWAASNSSFTRAEKPSLSSRLCLFVGTDACCCCCCCCSSRLTCSRALIAASLAFMPFATISSKMVRTRLARCSCGSATAGVGSSDIASAAWRSSSSASSAASCC